MVVSAVLFSVLCIVAALLYVRHRNRNFDVSRATNKYDSVCADDSKYQTIELKDNNSSSTTKSNDSNKNSKQRTQVTWKSPTKIKNFFLRPKEWTGSQEI